MNSMETIYLSEFCDVFYVLEKMWFWFTGKSTVSSSSIVCLWKKHLW